MIRLPSLRQPVSSFHPEDIGHFFEEDLVVSQLEVLSPISFFPHPSLNLFCPRRSLLCIALCPTLDPAVFGVPTRG